MCRWIAYRGRPIFLESLLFEPENSLISQSLRCRKADVATNGDGFGIGWYGARETPGVYRETLPAWNDRNLRSLAHHIQSPLFFGHVRASTGTATARINCHPFHHEKWLFMHNGQIGGYERLRRRLDQLLPDALYAARQGTTDSEFFFYLLFANGLEQDPVAALARSVAQVEEVMRASTIDEPFRLTAALTDGARIFAIRYASDGKPPSLYWCGRGDRLMIVSEPLDAEAHEWNDVPSGHVLVAETDVRVAPFTAGATQQAFSFAK
jgi:predicted glutamine amidotransferase